MSQIPGTLCIKCHVDKTAEAKISIARIVLHLGLSGSMVALGSRVCEMKLHLVHGFVNEENLRNQKYLSEERGWVVLINGEVSMLKCDL